jgi:hypothetical protein
MRMHNECRHEGTMHRYPDALCRRRAEQLAPEAGDGVVAMTECLECREFHVARRVHGETLVDIYATLSSALMRQQPLRREVRRQFGRMAS